MTATQLGREIAARYAEPPASLDDSSAIVVDPGMKDFVLDVRAERRAQADPLSSPVGRLRVKSTDAVDVTDDTPAVATDPVEPVGAGKLKIGDGRELGETALDKITKLVPAEGMAVYIAGLTVVLLVPEGLARWLVWGVVVVLTLGLVGLAVWWRSPKPAWMNKGQTTNKERAFEAERTGRIALMIGLTVVWIAATPAAPWSSLGPIPLVAAAFVAVLATILLGLLTTPRPVPED